MYIFNQQFQHAFQYTDYLYNANGPVIWPFIGLVFFKDTGANNFSHDRTLYQHRLLHANKMVSPVTSLFTRY